ncbi:S9 family peptidase [Fodinibius sediminis]|uniref:Dipeptidyl aminopeptidase/acylaminoacyl peptidase n=1 Tax=Fodinibius sediminis TaxID=1214077 RepID=A0A521EDL1_9BACT|nr:prolyl oligopeptidase family serine peptidase [Fodinibius sediminis]SMO82004.1 Dipeptidyl aminopeptidase/acylaminoacyl peptidase [Fodinibius sediminis]
MKYITNALLFILLLPGWSRAQSSIDTLSLRSLFYEPLLAGHRPDFTAFSPGAPRLYYEGNDSARIEDKYYSIALDGTDVRQAPDHFTPAFSASPDGKQLVYNHKDNIWIADAGFRNRRKLVSSPSSEREATWAPDSRRIAFIQDGEAWVLNMENSQLQQITHKKEEQPGYSIVGWAGPNKLILSQWDTSGYEAYYFPEYADQFVQAGETRRGIPRQILTLAYLDSVETEFVFKHKGYLNTSISITGRYLAIDERDAPMKRRTITVMDLQEQNSATVFSDSTRGWIYGTDLAFAPEGNRLMFLSEQDGWNHIYTVEPDGSDLRQHTAGNYEVPWAAWTGQGEILFASTRQDPGVRHVYTLDTATDEVERLTSRTGYRKNFQLSRTHNQLVYEYSYFNEPFELYALDLEHPGEEKRLTHTIPDRFKAIDWQKEDYLRFTGRDGSTELSMSVLEPLHKEPGKKYPVIVFVHGAGSLQNVYKGWSNSYYREYMFHQYLNARGYYVIEVDYRHSTGYGRQFREAVTNWMGKYESRDIIDGLHHLAGRYPQADTSSVGIYGGSYGGFMSLYATSVAPQYFDAAAALRAVTNWENYYHTNPWYTLPRLGTPEQDSTHYARSSPLTYVDQLEQPVLILHGLMDDNVGFQDAAQYIDELVQAGDKEFDMMMYPTERHSFEDPDAWFDEYRRIYDFFEDELK